MDAVSDETERDPIDDADGLDPATGHSDGDPPVGERNSARRSALTAALVLASIVAVLAWWWWPSLGGHGDDVDVVVVGAGFAPEAQAPLETRLREVGRSVAWLEGTGDRCSDATRIARTADRLSPGVVVVTAPDGPDCLTDAVADLSGVEGVVVVTAGDQSSAADLSASGLQPVDPLRLLGPAGTAVSEPCQWWEICPPDGLVVVRDVDGNPTDVGYERLARAVVATL